MSKSNVSRQVEDPRDEKSLHGHILIITARWVLVVVGLVLALYRPHDLFELEFSIVTILVLAVINFFLHVSTVTDRTIQTPYIYAATVGDVVVISTIVAMTGGATANSFVFYYPAVLAYTLVFPRMISLPFTAGVIGTYSFVALPSLIPS